MTLEGSAPGPVSVSGVVVAMMARAPSAQGKSRLAAHLDPVTHAALRAALFDDTFETLSGITCADRVVLCDPPEACDEVRKRVGTRATVVAQRGSDLGARLTHALDDLSAAGATAIVFIGSDTPDLPPARIVQAIGILAQHDDRVVLGPADDGGYYLIGVKPWHGHVFTDIAWGTDSVLRQTMARARRLGLRATRLAPWADVDTLDDLSRIVGHSNGQAPRTVACLQRLTAPDADLSIPGRRRAASRRAVASPDASLRGHTAWRSSDASAARTVDTRHTSPDASSTSAAVQTTACAPRDR